MISTVKNNAKTPLVKKYTTNSLILNNCKNTWIMTQSVWVQNRYNLVASVLTEIRTIITHVRRNQQKSYSNFSQKDKEPHIQIAQLTKGVGESFCKRFQLIMLHKIQTGVTIVLGEWSKTTALVLVMNTNRERIFDVVVICMIEPERKK